MSLYHLAADLALCLDPIQWARQVLNFHPDPIQASFLSSPSRRVLVNCCRQWGKSTTTAVRASHRAITSPGEEIVIISRTARQSAELARKIAANLARAGLSPKGDGDNAISLLLPNGSRIVGLPGTEATVRGFSAVGLLIVDEAAKVKDDTYRTVRPYLATRPDAELILLSTPFGRRGFFFEEWEKGGPHWQRFSVPASLCSRIPSSFLNEERQALGPIWFRQEYECEFLDVADFAFSPDLIHRAITDDVQPL